jgi:hypothetical protein
VYLSYDASWNDAAEYKDLQYLFIYLSYDLGMIYDLTFVFSKRERRGEATGGDRPVFSPPRRKQSKINIKHTSSQIY